MGRIWSSHPQSAVFSSGGNIAIDSSGCQHRPVPYLNNVLEQDHRAIKRRINASQHFRSFWGAWRTIAGYEAIHMIRKGQAWRSAAGAKVVCGTALFLVCSLRVS